MQETITATVTAARSAQTVLVNAIHDAADDMSRIGRDPVAEALAHLAREAKGARERLEASRLTARSILFDALQGFESFAAEVTAPVQHPLPAPAFVALDYAPEEPTVDATDGITDATPATEPTVDEPRGEDAPEVEAPTPAPEYPAEECEGCFDFSADVLPRPGGMRLCPSCERSRLDAEAAETRLVGLAVIAAQEGGEVLATAANEAAEPTPPAPKKARARRKAK
jgi:hypothetical protein